MLAISSLVNWIILLLAISYFMASLVGWLLILPASSAAKAGNHSLAISRGESLLKLGFLLPLVPRLILMYSMVTWCLYERQYRRSLDLATDLEQKNLPIGLRINLFRFKAECLDGLGFRDAAGAEIAKAENLSLTNASPDRLALTSRAQVLSKTAGHAAAYPLYQEALALTPKSAKAERQQILGHLVTGAHMTGQAADIFKWSSQLLEETKDPKFRIIGYRMAAIACSGAADVDGAERNIRAALEVARGSKQKTEVASLLAQLANTLMRRPDPESALATAEEAIATDPGQHQAWIAKAECCYAVGDFSEGLIAASQARKCNKAPVPSAKKNTDALLLMLMARGYNLMGDGEAALSALGLADPNLLDEKLRLWCAAFAGWSYAILGDRQRAGATIERVLDGRNKLPDARDLQVTSLGCAIRVNVMLSQLSSVDRLLEELLAQRPFPSEMAFYYYMMGKNAQGQANSVKVYEYFEAAAAIHPALHYSKLAQQELSGYSATVY